MILLDSRDRMLVFFISISFFIHALSLAAIYLMYQQVKSIRNSQTNEIDQIMQSYLKQIQIENNNLQESLHKKVDLNDVEQNKQTLSIDDLEESDEQKQYSVPESLIQTNNGDYIEASLECRVLELHRSGVELTDIAKQLHCGETEASLIIKFQKDKQA